MGSDTPLKLPPINFSNPGLNPGTQERDSVKSQVRKAVGDYGCFEALFDKVQVDLRKAIFSSLEELLDLPLQSKLRNVSKKPYHGYVGQYPQVPLFESMGIDDANFPEKVDNLSTLLWPDGNQSFSKTIQSFSEQLSELDQIVRRMMVESLGLDKNLDEHLNSTNYLLRVMKYKGPQTAETKLGLTAHIDKNIVTILFQNEVAGLEVQTKDGQWMTLKPSPDSFIVMIGDSLYDIHEQLFVGMGKGSTPLAISSRHDDWKLSKVLHRIVFNPKGRVHNQGPEEMIDEDHPLPFRPFDHVQFLNFHYSEEGQRALCALKAYCGV